MSATANAEFFSQLVIKIIVPLLDAIIDKSRASTLQELQEYLLAMRQEANNKSLIAETITAAFLQAQKELENKPQ